MGWHDANDDTPRKIDEAMRRGDLKTVRRIFKKFPEFLRSSDGIDTWLWGAAHRGDLPLVKLLVELGLSVNEPSDKEMPEGPLEKAATQGRLDVVRWFLENGAEVNHVFQGKRRCLPLVGAAYNGHLDVVKLLVQHGADIHSSWHCMNAIMHAKSYGQEEVVAYLHSLGAKDLRETTPPDYANAHKLIMEHMANERSRLSDWKIEIAGDPLVTIHHIRANDRSRKEQMLFTVGLSDRRLPAEWGEFACGELKLALAPNWPLTDAALADPKWNWPIEWLKRMVIELRKGDRWPAAPVIFSNGKPLAPFHPDTKLCCWLCLVSQGGSIQIPDCRWIDFHGVFPIYAEEKKLIEQMGSAELVNRFQDRGVALYIDPQRANMAT